LPSFRAYAQTLKGSKKRPAILNAGVGSQADSKFRLLLEGKWAEAGYHSQSDGDLALVGHLLRAFKDLKIVDRMFRASGMMREKWDERRGEKTYGEMTLEKASESSEASVTEQWDIPTDRASSIKAERIEWLWPGYIPRKMLVNLFAPKAVYVYHYDQGWASNDGGFVYYPGFTYHTDGGTKSYGSATYAGVISYAWANVKKDDARVQAVLKWVRDNYTLDENPGMGQKTVYYYYLVFAKALQAVGQPTIVDAKGRFHLDRQAALHARTRQHCFEPASDIRKAAQVVAVALGPARPADARHVRDRVCPGKEFTVPEPRIHHAIDPIHLVAEALDRIRQIRSVRRGGALVFDQLLLPGKRRLREELIQAGKIRADGGGAKLGRVEGIACRDHGQERP